MKKWMIIILAFNGVLFSCNKSDDNSNFNTSSILGSWKQLNQIDFCSTGSQEVFDFNTCEQLGRFTFNVNGTYSHTFYELNGDDCDLVEITNGTWVIIDNKLNISNQEENFLFTTFEVTQNSLKIGANVDSSDQEPCGNGVISSFISNFIRAE